MKKGKLYKAIGKGLSGEIFLAWAKCRKCGGVGTVGRNLINGGYVECQCLKYTHVPILWVVL